ncbi:MAG: US12 family protein [Candidatus Omnitrophica bacterium]|nr:US12 family protein [Candidatus Omnitrophota bacterium]
MFGTRELVDRQASIIKKTYGYLSLSVVAAIAGGFVGVSTPAVVNFFSGFMGWILAMILLNVMPMVAMAARGNPVLGLAALIGDGFVAGLVLAPILFMASVIAPDIVWSAMAITAIVFAAVTAYVMSTKRTFSAPKGLGFGIFVSIIGAVILNSFLNIGFLGILISGAIGIFGVCILVFATSDILNNPEADSPIPGALMLFAGLFNIFIAVLNILLAFSGGDD